MDECTGLIIPTASVKLDHFCSDPGINEMTFQTLTDSTSDIRALITQIMNRDQLDAESYALRMGIFLSNWNDALKSGKDYSSIPQTGSHLIKSYLNNYGILPTRTVSYKHGRTTSHSRSLFNFYDGLHVLVMSELYKKCSLDSFYHLRIRLKSMKIIDSHASSNGQTEFICDIRNCLERELSEEGAMNFTKVIELINYLMRYFNVDDIEWNENRHSGIMMSLEQVLAIHSRGDILQELETSVIHRIISWLEKNDDPQLYMLENNLLIEFNRRRECYKVIQKQK